MVQGALSGEIIRSRKTRSILAARRRRSADPQAPQAPATGEGDLPSNVDAAALARFVATVMHGMAVQAAGGAAPQGVARHCGSGVEGLACMIARPA